VLSAALLLVFGATLRAVDVWSGGSAPPPTRAPGDTVAVFGPVTMSTPNGNPTNHVVQFAVSVTQGQQYALQVVNGNPDGTLRVTGGSVNLNGAVLLTSAELAAGGPGWNKVVVPLANDTLLVTVEGAAGAFLTISLLAYADPTFKLFGTERFIRTTGPANEFTRNFTVTSEAGAPFQLCVLNGNPDGTNRLSSAEISLNGALVMTQSDLNQQVASLTRTINPVAGDNVLLIRLTSVPEGFLDICVTGTDIAPPVLTVTAPADSTTTNQISIPTSGTVSDKTRTIVTVNGVSAIVAADSTWSATVLLPTEGWQTLTYVATDAAGLTTTVVREIRRDTQAPALTVMVPLDNSYTKDATAAVSGTVIDASPVTVNTNGTPLGVTGTSFTGAVALVYGVNTLVTTATDIATNATSVVRTVTLDTLPPVLTVATPLEGASIVADSVVVSGTVTDDSPVTVMANGVDLPVSGTGYSGKIALVEGPNAINVIATDAATNAATVVRNVTRGAGLPPDPVLVASVLNRTEVSTIGAATEFLYSGTDPIQTGVAPGTIDPVRAAVVKGRVLDRQLQPLGGVTVSILGHPELGQTLSRADGGYDLAVNGGGEVTVDYVRMGYFPAQRRYQVPWQDYFRVDDVILLQPDSVVTTVDLTAASPAIARGSVVQDDDGSRQATLMFEPGTTATLLNPDSSTTPLTTIHVRATEYTVGDSGRLSMPATLPPASRYTYAVEVSVDEAGPGATVVFSQPVPLYVENFLDFPVGTPVPTGWYDRTEGEWVPERNGVVLEVVGVDGNGRAQLDVTGDGVADGVNELNLLGISDYELVQLAGTYPAGSDLWRALVPRSTGAGDLNFPWVEVGSAPTQGAVQAGCSSRGSDPIRCQLQAQTAFQSVGLVGSPFTLNYASDRTQGNAADRKLDITLTGATLPPFLLRVELEVDVAGQRFRGSFTPAANLTHTFVWDGKDIYDRTVQGVQQATVLIGYVFPVFYARPAPGDTSFALPCLILAGGCQLPGAPQTIPRAEQVTVQIIRTSLGTLDATALGLGGFTLDAQHVYDPVGQTLFQGDGTRRAASGLPPGIRTLAGNGSLSFFLNNGIPAVKEELSAARHVAITPDGSVYIADFRNPMALRKVTPDGIIHTVVGFVTGTGPNGDGGPAALARIAPLHDLTAGPDGSVYLLENTAKVRKIDPAGIITTVAGNGIEGFSGDGGPATAASIKAARGIAVGPDGSLYIGDGGNRRIRRVGTDGIIHTIAGTGVVCGSVFFHPTDASFNAACGNGIPASQAPLGVPHQLSVGPDGTLYFLDNANGRVRRIAPDGKVWTVVGNPQQIPNGDGGPVGLASIWGAKTITVGKDGSLYIASSPVDARPIGCRVRRVDPTGIINTFVGGEVCGFSGDGGPASAARIGQIMGMVTGPDGNLYVGDNSRIRRVSGFLPSLGAGQTTIATEDGGALMVFSAAGRHLLTLDAVTRDTIYQFGYNAERLLVSVTDRDGRVTQIVRDANGVPTSIVMPNGQVTAVELDANGNLASLTGPDGLPVRFSFASNGLLAGAVNQAGDSVARYVYDATGKVIGTTNSLGGTTTFAETLNGFNTTLTLQPPTGQSLTFSRTRDLTGAEALSALFAGTLFTATTLEDDGDVVTTAPDGTVTTIARTPDPRFGVQSTLGTETVRLPSGLTRVIRSGRAVTLSDPVDPFSITQEIDSFVVNGRVNRVVQNKVAKTVTATSAAGRTIAHQLDAAGRIVGTTAPGLPAAQLIYDVLGRVSQAKVGGRVQTFGYDARDRVSSVTDPLGLTSSFTYDSSGRVTQRQYPDGRVLVMEYDPNGNLVSVSPPSRPAHRMVYGAEHQITTYTAPDAGTGAPILRYSYDTANRVRAITRPDSSTIQITYAESSLSQTVNLPGGETLQLDHDPVTGNLTSTTLTDGASLAHSYDGALRTGTSWSGSVTGSVTQTYDTDFRVASQSVNGGSPINRAYDADGLLTVAGAITLMRSPQTGFLTGTTLGGIGTTRGYVPGPEQSSSAATFGATTLYSSNYIRDSLGRITTKTEIIGGVSSQFVFAYDSAGRLSVVTKDGMPAESYEYDANGNRVQASNSSGTASSTVDAQDRLVARGATSYSYATNGELRQKVVGADTVFYTYDALGNLRAVRQPNGTLIEYLVDGEGRRVGRKVNGTLQRTWLWDGSLAVVAEFDGDGQLLSRFVYGDQANVPEYMIRGGSTYRIITDERGSVRLVVDASTGAVTQRLDYDAYGRVLQDTNAEFQPFGFAGGLYDGQTGLVRFGARDYDADAGRWTAKDPIVFAGGNPNLYEYSHNDPVNHVDPRGLCEGGLSGCLATVSAHGTLITAAGNIAARNIQKFARAYSVVSELTVRVREEIVLLEAQGALAYPTLIGKVNEWHHIIPRYLGGPHNGYLVQLTSPYHRMITTAFQQVYAYKQPFPSPDELINVLVKVYTQLPLSQVSYWTLR
jgi:RHS repeat-associated protein